jgi:hypothetical protein
MWWNRKGLAVSDELIRRITVPNGLDVEEFADHIPECLRWQMEPCTSAAAISAISYCSETRTATAEPGSRSSSRGKAPADAT